MSIKDLIHAVVLAALVTLVGSGQATAAPGSDLSVTARLYPNGERHDGTRGVVREFVGWRDCVYVSFTTLEGDYYLDVWSIADPRSPELLSEHYHGNVDDDGEDLVPIAHLKSPRDLRILDSHLVYWKESAGHVQPLRQGCSIEKTSKRFLFSYQEWMNRLSYGGQTAMTEMFNPKTLFNEHHLINMQNPNKPFLNGRFLSSGPLAGSYQGLPAVIEMSAGNSQLKITTFEQNRSEHVQHFHGPLLAELFQLTNGDQSLAALLNSVVSAEFAAGQKTAALNAIFDQLKRQRVSKAGSGKKKGKKSKKKKKKGAKKQKKQRRALVRQNIPALLRWAHPPASELREVFAEYGIQPTDSVSRAVRKAIEAHISMELDRAIANQAFPALMERWAQHFVRLSTASRNDVTAHLTSVLDRRLDAEGLSAYLLDVFISPLLGNPQYMKLTLDEMLNGITGTKVAKFIDGALDAFHTGFPFAIALNEAGFSPPNCFAIPESSRELLDRLFVDSGPRLNPNGRTFFELLKLAQYYLGNTDFPAFEAELLAKAKRLHRDLGIEIVDQLASFLDSVNEGQATLQSQLESFGGGYTLVPAIGELLAELLIERLPVPEGLDEPVSSMAVRDYLLAFGLYLDPVELRAGEPPDTLAGLAAHMSRSPLRKITLKKLFQRARRVDPGQMIAHLRRPVEQVTTEVFGTKSLNITLTQAVEGLVIGRMDPTIVGEFTQELVGHITHRIENGSSFFQILGAPGLAAQGDCISQWIVAIDAASLILMDTVIFSAEGALMATLNAGLQAAVESSLSFAFEAMFTQLVGELFSKRGSFNAWYAALESQQVEVNLASLGAPPARLADFALNRDRVAVVLRNVGFLGAINPAERPVQGIIFDPRNAAATKELVDFGEWQRVSSVKGAGDVLLIAGDIWTPTQGAVPAVLLYDFTTGTRKYLYGDDAILFSSTPMLRVVKNGEGFGIVSEAGGVVLVDAR